MSDHYLAVLRELVREVEANRAVIDDLRLDAVAEQPSTTLTLTYRLTGAP